MSSYCSKCKNNTEGKNPEVSKTKNWKIMLLPRCAVCGNKKIQETYGLLSQLGIRTPLSKNRL